MTCSCAGSSPSFLFQLQDPFRMACVPASSQSPALCERSVQTYLFSSSLNIF